jgi:hypothetical protein
MSREHPSYPNGANRYASYVTLCWRLNRLSKSCVPTVLDTGSPVALIAKSALPSHSAVAVALPGTKVSISTSTGKSVWTYVTARQPPDALAVIGSTPIPRLSITGIGPYFGRSVTFDFKKGQIVFSPTHS